MGYLRHKPTGERIEGTFDMIPGSAAIADVRRDDTGSLVIDYAGGTDVWWDSQATVTAESPAGQHELDPAQRATATGLMFVTEHGRFVAESEVELVEDEDATPTLGGVPHRSR